MPKAVRLKVVGFAFRAWSLMTKGALDSGSRITEDRRRGQRWTKARQGRSSTNKVVQTIPFDETIAPTRSYLNDVRVDTKTGHAFITDSGAGAIVVVDLKTGQARRLLANHPSTKAEPGAEIVVDGMKLLIRRPVAPEFHSDGIAFDKEGGWLYYYPLMASPRSSHQNLEHLPR